MDGRVPKSERSRFRRPEEAFATLGFGQISDLILASCDVGLVVDLEGNIRDVACAEESPLETLCEDWLDRSWFDTVTIESYPKIEALMKDARDPHDVSWRQVNHFTAHSGDVPVSYATFSLSGTEQILAIGRDMSKVAEEQRRMMSAQLAMERAYARLQSSELRYRQIFQSAGEAILVIDCTTMKIREANKAATRLFSYLTNKLEGRRIKEVLKGSGVDVADTLMQAALGNRVVSNLQTFGDDEQHVDVNATLLREDKRPILVLHLTAKTSEGAETTASESRAILETIQHLPDGFVVTTDEGRIVSANAAFAGFVQVINTDQLWGAQFDSWFDRTGVDYNVLISNLREHGIVRRFATVLRGEAGTSENVEMAATEVRSGELTLHAFVIRPVNGSDRTSPINDGLLPYSAEQLTGLVGHMSLKDVVRETTSVIERLCIEAALELTNGNRASAAQLLGLSRQGLYDKLAKTGLAES